MATVDYMIASYGPYSASATGGNALARDVLAGVAAMYSTPCQYPFPPSSIPQSSSILKSISLRKHWKQIQTWMAHHYPRCSRYPRHPSYLRLLLERPRDSRKVEIRTNPSKRSSSQGYGKAKQSEAPVGWAETTSK